MASPRDREREEALDECPGYFIKEKIGEGAFGSIFRVRRSLDGREFALKHVSYGDDLAADDKYLLAEIYCLSKLDHPHIMALEEIFIHPGRVCIIMEHAETGSLDRYISSDPPPGADRVLPLYLQLLSAICYCHSRYIAHRDITPGNILLTGAMTVKLADWGLAMPCRDDSGNAVLCDDYLGDSRFQSPEVLRNSPFHPLPADVWSLGSVLHFSLTRAPLSRPPEAVATDGADKLTDLIRLMTIADPSERPAAQHVFDICSQIKLNP